MKWVSASLMQKLDRAFDAVITTGAGYPLDMTFYQSIKGITAASHIVRQGGKILLFGACDEGVGAPEFTRMVCEHTSDKAFMKSIEGVPVTVDQWQLEKLALATQKAEVSYCVPGVPQEFMRGLWGPGFRDPSEAVAALFAQMPVNSRIAVIPEGPYVLAAVA
jgi:nickel-dependent lactate racemase